MEIEAVKQKFEILVDEIVVSRTLAPKRRLGWRNGFTDKPVDLYTSQGGQDYICEQLFNRKETGYFIEMGAHDGKKLSNTWLFEEKYNWNGICIEPNSISYEGLVKNRKCHCDNSCVFSKREKVIFNNNEKLSV